MQPLNLDSLMPDDADRHEITRSFNNTESDYPKDKLVHQLFEEQAGRSPESVAVAYGERRLSYGELNGKANQLARHLRRCGVGPGVLVGICMHRCPELIVAILAVLKSGGAYVPLDPSYPKNRLAAMMRDIDLAVLLTAEDLRDALPEHKALMFRLDQDWSAVAAEDTGDLPVSATPEDLAYVVFTSGSTGKAKAAAVHHRGWTNLLSWFKTEFRIEPADRTLLISSFSFDITQRSIAMPLVAGGELHLLTSKFYDPRLAFKTIGEQKITLLNCAPSMFYPLIENPAEWDLANLRSLRVLFLGGEAISGSRLQHWAEMPDCRTEVVNVYGAAECTDVSSFYRLNDYRRYVESSVPIGTPIFNSRLYLLNEELCPVPFGTVGEICIAGDGVGKGYINDAALTAGKFVLDPLADRPGERLYRTGDLGKFLPDRMLAFVGRVDQEVKLHGARIHLGDIETALRYSPLVREAVVLKKTYGLDERLVAYLVLDGERAPAELETRLTAFLGDRLPPYMVPGEYRIFREMPLTPNGKIDRKALLDSDGEPPTTTGIAVREELELGGGAAVGAPALTATEDVLIELWRKILRVDRAGVNDDFFDLGGDSLKAITLIGEISKRLAIKIPLGAVFEAPTIRDLSKRIGKSSRPANGPPVR